MKKSLVLAMAMALGVTASAYAANPFSDVPAGHWAYDSISKLAAAGVIEGYGDTTFGGDKLMTRYEMAQIVAKAMARGANVDKLAAEFADELDSLGVRVANLEKKADNVKITGEIRYHYADRDGKELLGSNKSYEHKLRTRLWVSGQINDDWTYTGMVQNNQDFVNNSGDETLDFQRAYVNGKLGGVKVQAGRYHARLSDGNFYAQRFDGIQASYGKDIKLTLGYGKPAASSKSHIMNQYKNADKKLDAEYGDKAFYARLDSKVGKADLGAAYYNFKYDNNAKIAKNANATTEDEVKVWEVHANYNFDNNVKLGAMYLKGDDMGKNYDDDGFIATLSYKGAKAAKPGSWGLTASYYDQGAPTYVDQVSDGYADNMLGFKGYSIAANYAFAKNIVGTVQWFDFEEKEGSKNDIKTLWSQLIFNF